MSFLDRLKTHLFQGNDKDEQQSVSEADKQEIVVAEQPTEVSSMDLFLKVTDVDLSQKNAVKIPITELSGLGSMVASMLPQFRTITQSINYNTEGLYRVVNQKSGEVLSMAKNGDFWPSLKSSMGGKGRLARFEEVSSVNAINQITMPIDPVTIMMAATLYSIEQKLDQIEETSQHILSFLENEKESQIEADLGLLESTMKEFKFNWDKDVYVNGHYKLALDIKRNSLKNLRSYKKEVENIQKSNTLVESTANVNAVIEKLLRTYRYYQMALYTFGMSSYVEVVLLGDFREEHISKIRTEIQELSMEYRQMFSTSSDFIEKTAGKTVESNVLKGLGAASKTLGAMLGSIPLIKDGPVDEWLSEGGEKLNQQGLGLEQGLVQKLKEASNPMTGMFLEKIDSLNTIFNKTSEIYFDKDKIYLLAA